MFLLGTCFITLPFIGDNVFSFCNGYMLSSFCTRNTQHCHPTLKNGGDTFRIIYAGGVCEYSDNPATLYPNEGSQTTAERLLLGITLTEIDERQRRCLVQRTIDTTQEL